MSLNFFNEIVKNKNYPEGEITRFIKLNLTYVS